jgi:hypothetical protein
MTTTMTTTTEQESQSGPGQELSSVAQVIVGVTFGCNKGDDAVHMLAKLSGDRRIDVTTWQDTYAELAGGSSMMHGRACPEHPMTLIDTDHPLQQQQQQQQQRQPPVVHATMFCVEAGTKTAEILQRTKEVLGGPYLNSYVVTHAAMGPTSGVAYFPKMDLAGKESNGLCDASVIDTTSSSSSLHNNNTSSDHAPDNDSCERVTMYTADKYMDDVVDVHLLQHVDLTESATPTSTDPATATNTTTATTTTSTSDTLIEILSVDVEGFDWDVLGLGGANRTLRRTKYLEFEYHLLGHWPRYDLSMVTETLWNEYGFVCYYAGVDKLWRLTNCFQQYFNVHSWSNVACVNPTLNRHLATIMESMFQRQLSDPT